MSGLFDAAVSGTVHTEMRIQSQVNQFEDSFKWLGRTLIPQVGYSAKTCGENISTVVPYIGTQFRVIAYSIKRIATAALNILTLNNVAASAKTIPSSIQAILTLKGWKVVDRTSKLIMSISAIAQILENVPVAEIKENPVLKNITAFVGARNIFDTISRFSTEYIASSWGLKKVGWVLKATGNTFETCAILQSKGILQPLIHTTIYPILWAASTTPGALVVGAINQGIGFVTSTAVWNTLVQFAAQTGSIPLFGPLGQAVYDTASQMSLKQYKDLFIAISFTISCIEITRQLVINNPKITGDEHEKFKWTMLEQGSKVSLICAGNGIQFFGIGFAKTFVKTAQFIYMAAVVNTIAEVKSIMYDLKLVIPKETPSVTPTSEVTTPRLFLQSPVLISAST